MSLIKGKQIALAPNGIATGNINDLAVTTPKIAAGAVTTVKITIDANLPGNAFRATGWADPIAAQDLATKFYVDALVAAGVRWKAPVATMFLVGNATVAVINALGGLVAGDAYVVTDAGVVVPGAVAVVAGDTIEWNGLVWVNIITNIGGFVPSGTRMVLTSRAPVIAPYATPADRAKIVSFGGASNTGTDTGEAVDGNAVLDSYDGTFNENRAFVNNGGTGAFARWPQFSGVTPINAGNGLTKDDVTNTLDVNAGDGIDPVFPGDAVTVLAADGSVVVSPLGVRANRPTNADKDMAPAATVGDGASTTLAMSNTSVGYVMVFLNGVEYSVGNGVTTKDSYWSTDGGVTPLSNINVPAGAILYWNGVIVGFNLAVTDEMDFKYNTT